MNSQSQRLPSQSSSAASAGPSELFPVSLVLDLYNNVANHHPLRDTVVQYVNGIAEKNPKAHWARAIVCGDDGTLRFDNQLYWRAVYRGKQETRLAEAQRRFDALQSELEILATFHEKEQLIAMRIDTEARSKSLVPMPAPSLCLAHIQGKPDQLLALRRRLANGLVNNLARTFDGSEDEQ